MNKIIINNANLGGIADSKYQGQQNSVAEMVGFDIHSEPGILKNNQKLAKESGATVDDLVKKILPCSDGNSYLFGSTNGKIWKRTSAGVYSLADTASPASGGVGIMDAYEYQGHIYYSMESRLDAWPLVRRLLGVAGTTIGKLLLILTTLITRLKKSIKLCILGTVKI